MNCRNLNERSCLERFIYSRSLMVIGLRMLLPLFVFITITTANADQNAPELPGLFEQLGQATDAHEAAVLEREIWELWLQAPDASSGLLLSQISRAIGAGRLELALRLSDQLVDSAPQFAEGWNKRATAHYLLGNNAESVADIRETIRLEPKHFGAIAGLGMIFLRDNNLQAALEAFLQVQAISPASMNAKLSVENVRSKLEQEI